MRCLWLTWIDPSPEHDGQRIYSGRLIDAVAAAGVQLDVLCSANAESRRRDGQQEGRIRWWLTPPRFRPVWSGVFSDLPHVAHRSNTREMQARFLELLERGCWDRVVFDGLYPGWALDSCLARFSRGKPRPKLIYVAHNHERTMRANITANYRGSRVKKLMLQRDARRVARLEHRLVAAADLVTAITPDDAALFSIQHPRKPVLVLTPGYRGRRLDERRLTAKLPRRAVMVGSFEWVAKQENLREFLAVADPLFASAGAELQIVGNGDRAFLDKLRGELSAVRLVGRVERVEPYLEGARLAVVAERLGGGFKLKVLDYVFNRVPIAALAGSVAGTPLEPRKSILTYPSLPELAKGVLRAIDDLDLLNSLQASAYAVCEPRFHWGARGQQLLNAMASL